MTTLDIGSGPHKRGDVSIDIDPNVRPNVIAVATALPFKENSFSRVYLVNVLEHIWEPPFSPKESVLKALMEANRVLKHDGICEIFTPNFSGIGTLLKWLLQRGEGFDWGYFIMGGHHGEFQVHHIAFTLPNLRKVLYQAGFKRVTFHRTNLNASQMERLKLLIPRSRHDHIHAEATK